MKSPKYIFLIFLAVILLLSGCSPVSSENNMLRPPRATGDKAEIQHIISQQAGGKYTFKYPQTGEYRSAITMKKEKAENEFALALYSPDNDTKINVCIIAFIDSKWQCIGNFANACTGVDRVMFRDLNNDGTDEIIIGWTSYNNAQKTLSAYSVADTAYEIALEDTYNEMIIEDVTGDDVSDIVLLSLATQKNPSNFKVLQYSETEKKPVARYSIDLDPEIISFANITCGNIAQNQKGIVIDGEKNGGILTSQIVYFDENANAFMNPLITENENGTFSNPTSRKDTIYSRDSDSDYIIEVPVVTPMPAPAENTALNICSITAWKQYSVYNKALGTKTNTVINYNDRYYMTMPNKWINNTVTAVTDTDTRKMTFYLWNSKTSSFGDKLLEISRYTSEEFQKLDKSNIIPLNIENPNAVFCAEIFLTNADDELNITPEEVVNSVHEFWKN